MIPLRIEEFGDLPGHEFRGNQYTGGLGGEAEKAAARVLRQAKAAEPRVTAALRQAVSSVPGAKLEGLDFRLKSQSSLTDKIKREALASGTSADAQAAKIGDALRYTVTAPPDQQAAVIDDTVKLLQARGIAIKNEDIENYWVPGDAYNGINAQGTLPSGMKFELQFHTPDSYDIKTNVIHKDYEEYRDPDTAPDRRRELFAKMTGISDAQQFPTGPFPGIPTFKGLAAAATSAEQAAAWYYGLGPIRIRVLDGGAMIQVLNRSTGDWEDQPDAIRYFVDPASRDGEKLTIDTPHRQTAAFSGLERFGFVGD